MRTYILCILVMVWTCAWLACDENENDDHNAYGDYSDVITQMSNGCDISMDGLKDVGYMLNLASCEIWADALTDGDWVLPLTWLDLAIEIAGVQATSTDWAVDERYLVYGRFDIAGAGSVIVGVNPASELSHFVPVCENDPDDAWEPADKFAILGEIREFDEGPLDTDDLIVELEVNEFPDSTGRYNSVTCLLELD